jgi:hypothetical protein
MPIFLRQSTASQEIPLGYFVDSTDGNTAETALSIANTDIDIWKTGATTLADKNSGGATHIAGGIYYCVLDATDTDTIGPLVVYCKVAGALATRTECCVLDEAVYDSLFGTAALITSGTGTGQLSVTSGVASANVTQWLGNAAATPTVAGVPEVDVTHWIGTAAATPTVAGVPEVDITHIGGSAVSTTTAQLGVNVVQISTDATAADNLELQYDGTGLQGDTYPVRQDQLSTVTTGSSAISTTAESFTLTTGSEGSGTYASTAARDGTYHRLDDAAGTFEGYYQFDIGADGIPVNVNLYGYVNGNNDTVGVFAYNWGGATWQQIGSIVGQSVSTPAQYQFACYAIHVGTGANLGKVRIRLYATGLTSSQTFIDQAFASYTVVRRTVGYQDGAVWLDTVNGTAGTTLWTNGTADYPCNTIANAITVATALGVKKINIVNGSSVTLAASMADYTLAGDNWTLALGGQSIDGATITGAHITGTGTGTAHCHFTRCEIGTSTLPTFKSIDCYWTGVVTMGNATSDYFITNAVDGVAGNNNAEFTFAANCHLHLQGWSGGVTINSMAAGSTVEVNGGGTMTLAASCTGGTALIRGAFDLTDSSGGAVTITDTARWNENQNVTNVTGNVTGSVGSVTGNVGGNVTGSVGSVGAGGITAASFAAGAVDAAALAADAVNEIWAKAMSDLAAVPAINASVLDAINFIFCLSRNALTQTSAQSALKRDDGTTTFATSNVGDDGTTFTRSEWT